MCYQMLNSVILNHTAFGQLQHQHSGATLDESAGWTNASTFHKFHHRAVTRRHRSCIQIRSRFSNIFRTSRNTFCDNCECKIFCDDNNDSWFVNAGAQHLMHALCVTMYLEPHTKGAWLFVSTIWNIFIEPDLMVLLFAESLPIHFCHDKYLLCHCRIILSITWVYKWSNTTSVVVFCFYVSALKHFEEWCVFICSLYWILKIYNLNFTTLKNIIIVYKNMHSSIHVPKGIH